MKSQPHKQPLARLIGATVALVLLSAPTLVRGQAAEPFVNHPGYLHIENYLTIDPSDVVTEINLRGGLLQMVAAAAKQNDPEFARAVQGLQLIQVRVVKPDASEMDRLASGFAAINAEIDAKGWETIVKHRDQETNVTVSALPGLGNTIEGLAVLVLGTEETVVINIVGTLDLEAIAAVGSGLNIDILKNMDMSGKREEAAGAEEG